MEMDFPTSATHFIADGDGRTRRSQANFLSGGGSNSYDEPQNSTFRSDSEHRLISGELTRDSSALNASEGGHHVSESLKMDPEQHFGLSEDFGSHPKYKQSILQRYLNDTYQHVMPAFVEDAPFTKTRGRRESGSLGSRDYEEMSTSSAASPLNDNHLNVFEDFPEELEMARKRRPADDNGCEEDIYWKEISAALALASLARSKKKT